jgi:hypothetical protein
MTLNLNLIVVVRALVQVDEEQLGVPERAAAGGGAGHGPQLQAAVPRRRRSGRHRQQLTGVAQCVPARLLVPLYADGLSARSCVYVQYGSLVLYNILCCKYICWNPVKVHMIKNTNNRNCFKRNYVKNTAGGATAHRLAGHRLLSPMSSFSSPTHACPLGLRPHPRSSLAADAIRDWVREPHATKTLTPSCS